MIKYLFAIFHLCVVMFLNLGHQLAKGETCVDGCRGNARYTGWEHFFSDLLYTQLQKKPISHFSGQFWKSELRNENIFITYSVAISSATFH